MSNYYKCQTHARHRERKKNGTAVSFDNNWEPSDKHWTTQIQIAQTFVTLCKWIKMNGEVHLKRSPIILGMWKMGKKRTAKPRTKTLYWLKCCQCRLITFYLARFRFNRLTGLDIWIKIISRKCISIFGHNELTSGYYEWWIKAKVRFTSRRSLFLISRAGNFQNQAIYWCSFSCS